MLIKRSFLHAIADGEVTLAFRRWKRPSVRPGTRLRTEVGIVAIDAVQVVREADVAEADARRAGFASKAQLLADLRADPNPVLYRIQLRFAGEDPRVALREKATLSDAEVAEIQRRLGRLDQASTIGSWTRTVLGAIAKHPEKAAGELASLLQLEKQWLKVNVRKLKELGLTESLQPGYRLSPRGKVFLSAISTDTASSTGPAWSQR